MATQTSRLGLDEPASTDNISGFPAEDVEALGILDNAAIYLSGALASRPSAPVDGTLYHATDTDDVSVFAGSAWISLAKAQPSLLAISYPSRAITGSFTLTTTSPTQATFGTYNWDANGWNNGSGGFKVDKAGIYRVSVNAPISTNASALNVSVGVMHNGSYVQFDEAQTPGSSAALFTLGASDDMELSSSDTIYAAAAATISSEASVTSIAVAIQRVG